MPLSRAAPSTSFHHLIAFALPSTDFEDAGILALALASFSASFILLHFFHKPGFVYIPIFSSVDRTMGLLEL